MYVVTLPLYLTLERKQVDDKLFPLNLNVYRNAHFYMLNETKILFKKCVEKEINLLPVFSVCSIKYTVFLKRKADIMNFISVVDKYFCDALVELGKIPDDNCDVIQNISIEFGGYDKINPRVEAIISGQIKENNVKVILTKEEIDNAICHYVTKAFTVGENMALHINTSGDCEVSIEILPTGSTVVTPEVSQVVTRRGRKKAAEPEVVVEAEPVAVVFPSESDASFDDTCQEDKQGSLLETPKTTEPVAEQPRRSLFGNITRPVNS